MRAKNPHIFAAVTFAEESRHGHGCVLELDDGSTMAFPEAKSKQYRKIVAGDKVLVDLGEWSEHEERRARIYVLRHGHLETNFEIGQECTINSPATGD